MTSKGPLDWILDKSLGQLPKDPLTQTNFMYRLMGIIVVSFLGFAIERWILFFTTLSMDAFFYGILLTCFATMSLFNFRSMRDAYNLLKNQKPLANDISPEQIESELKEKKLTPEQEKKQEQIEKALDKFEEEVDSPVPKSMQEVYPEDSFPAVIGRAKIEETKIESKKGNPWMDHVKIVRAENKGKTLKEIFKIAKETYKK